MTLTHVTPAAPALRRPWLAPLLLIGGAILFALVEGAEIRFADAHRPRRFDFPRMVAELLAPWLILALLGGGIAWLSRRFMIYRGDGRVVGRSANLCAIAVHVVAAALFPVASLTLLATWHEARAALRGAGGGSWSHLAATARDLLGEYYVVDLAIYALIAAACHAAAFLREARARAQRELELERSIAQARLEALRQQLRPHFLFNAMNTVAMLVRANERDAAVDALARLASLLRASLRESAAREVPLADELAIVRDYLAIEQARFGGRLQISIDVPGELHGAAVPAWLLQPLVENAVRHGVGRLARPGRIEIAARWRADALELSVRDDGPGPDRGAAAPDARPRGGGVGLANLRARLDALYAGAASFELAAGAAGGAVACAILPWRATAAEAQT